MPRRLRILFLAHLFPLPTDSGGKIKSYYTLKTLSSAHDVYLLAYLRGDDERALIPEISSVCSRVECRPISRGPLRQAADLMHALVTDQSFIISRDYRRHMQSAVDHAVREFEPDVIHIDHLQMAQFVDFQLPCKTVLDQHNVESMIIRRISESSGRPLARAYSRLEWPKLQRYESDICGRCDLVLAVSDEDRDTLRTLNPSLTNVESVPIGIDTNYLGSVRRNADSANILFLGTMYWPPNVDCVHYFHRDILPLVRERIPNCTFTIAGQRPAKSIVALSSDPTVRVTGYVDDVRNVAEDCGVFVVPLRAGSGVRVKILNAMAMGLPVVSTSVGAEGIDIVNGEHALIADSPADFAEATARVLEDRDLADRLGRNARRLACDKYSWDMAGKRVLNLYDRNFGSVERPAAGAPKC